ncbi:glutaredoxin family protein [Oceanobacter kriegii]|uniref:glutaredoxin family protein n=1 Tax=Oceanobacter kriegii TaxID=64972 RepID=UPI001B7FDDC4|nr:glutaredoxin family protein [Oceanobacter kriegii]
MSFTLFGTEGCHLCDIAEQLILQSAGHFAEPVWQQDIAEDERLVENYGIHIPVLRHDACGSELSWPFNGAQLLEWLTQHQSCKEDL